MEISSRVSSNWLQPEEYEDNYYKLDYHVESAGFTDQYQTNINLILGVALEQEIVPGTGNYQIVPIVPTEWVYYGIVYSNYNDANLNLNGEQIDIRFAYSESSSNLVYEYYGTTQIINGSYFSFYAYNSDKNVTFTTNPSQLVSFSSNNLPALIIGASVSLIMVLIIFTLIIRKQLVKKRT